MRFVGENMRVYLDDERKPGGDWIVTHTPAETIALLETGMVDELSLDHDLGGDETIGTGYTVLLWLEEAVAKRGFVPPPKIDVHSMNSSAKEKMIRAIEQIRRLAERNR